MAGQDDPGGRHGASTLTGRSCCTPPGGGAGAIWRWSGRRISFSGLRPRCEKYSGQSIVGTTHPALFICPDDRAESNLHRAGAEFDPRPQDPDDHPAPAEGPRRARRRGLVRLRGAGYAGRPVVGILNQYRGGMGGRDYDRGDSTAPHITLGPQTGWPPAVRPGDMYLSPQTSVEERAASLRGCVNPFCQAMASVWAATPSVSLARASVWLATPFIQVRVHFLRWPRWSVCWTPAASSQLTGVRQQLVESVMQVLVLPDHHLAQLVNALQHLMHVVRLRTDLGPPVRAASRAGAPAGLPRTRAEPAPGACFSARRTSER